MDKPSILTKLSGWGQPRQKDYFVVGTLGFGLWAQLMIGAKLSG
jgi:hypothetical protein